MHSSPSLSYIEVRLRETKTSIVRVPLSRCRLSQPKSISGSWYTIQPLKSSETAIVTRRSRFSVELDRCNPPLSKRFAVLEAP